MHTFGDRLRHERESRNARIQDVSERTRINSRYLEALENNDFDALPGARGFGKLYIRAYAEMLGFDAQPLIEAFDEEQDKRRKAELERPRNVPAGAPSRVMRTSYAVPPEEPVVGGALPAEAEAVFEAPTDLPTEVAAQPPASLEPARFRGGRVIIAAVAGTTLLALAGIALMQESRPPSTEGAAATSAVVAPRAESTVAEFVAVPLEPPSGETVGNEPREPASTERASAPVQETEIAPAAAEVIPGLLDVTEFSVGERVVDRRMVGPGTRFKEGAVAAFLTRVTGGVAGQKIHHVWMHEGRVVQSIELSLGGSHWRTHSNKRLSGQGSWAVEARAADGEVLARADFICDAP